MIGRFKIKNSNLKIYTLVGVALVLGAAIYNQQMGKNSTLNYSDVSPSPTTSPRLLPENLTEDEKFILNPPPADASKSALQKHAQTVKKLAKGGNSLEITNCQPSPRVLGVKQGTDITIKNSDSVSHWVIFDEDHLYEIPANNSQTITANFKYGTGDYGYVCKKEDSLGLVGFLHVSP